MGKTSGSQAQEIISAWNFLKLIMGFGGPLKDLRQALKSQVCLELWLIYLLFYCCHIPCLLVH